MCFDSRIDSVLCNPRLKEFTRWSTCFSFLLESSLCTTGLWPVPPEVCFFPPSAQMYENEGCGPAKLQATQSQRAVGGCLLL